MHPITQIIKSLEEEQLRLEERFVSINHEIEDIRRNCEHLDEQGNSTFTIDLYDGVKNIQECSICGKRRTRKRSL